MPSIAAENFGRTWVLVPAMLLIAAACLLPADVPVARFCREGHWPRILVDVLHCAETFGHGMGVLLILMTVACLDSRARRLVPALAASAYSAGLIANVFKLFIERTRPRHFEVWQASWVETFGDWLPFLSGGSAGQSFPSAHTATAVGLAVALSGVYPRGRWWFTTLAVLVGLQRIQSSAHYPSDVCVGAAIGWLAGNACLAITRRLQMQKLDDAAPNLLPFRRSA